MRKDNTFITVRSPLPCFVHTAAANNTCTGHMARQWALNRTCSFPTRITVALSPQVHPLTILNLCYNYYFGCGPAKEGDTIYSSYDTPIHSILVFVPATYMYHAFSSMRSPVQRLIRTDSPRDIVKRTIETSTSTGFNDRGHEIYVHKRTEKILTEHKRTPFMR